MKTNKTKWRVRGLCTAVAMSFAGTATAGIPVIDILNLGVNEVKKLELFYIMSQLDSGGEINTYTSSIDDSTKTIDRSTTNIDEWTTNIDHTTETILDYTVKNYEITYGDFQVIIGGGGGVVPIPDIAGEFGSVSEYQGRVASADVLATTGMDGSVARKEANDQLVKTMIDQQGSLKHDMDQVQRLMEESTSEQGHGKQFQYANAISGEEAHQLLQLRSLMLASSNAKSAASQAKADRHAQEIAATQNLRRTSPMAGREMAGDSSL